MVVLLSYDKSKQGDGFAETLSYLMTCVVTGFVCIVWMHYCQATTIGIAALIQAQFFNWTICN
jgi:hypothetical protein